MSEKYLADLPRTTLSDFPGISAAILFFQGCNMRCPFCHNKEILKGEGCFTLEEGLDRLGKMRKIADGVVLSGGEPTMCPEIGDFIIRLREMGFQVKLDTNGTKPDILEKIAGYVDYIAMDIKSEKEQYHILSGVWKDTDAVKGSCSVIKESGTAHEFRTTVVPGLHSTGSLEQLYEEFGLEDARSYVLQRYLPVDGFVQREHTREEWHALVSPLEKKGNVTERGYFT